MSSTYLSLNYHVIFSTKNRHPFLQPDLKLSTHRYLAGTIKGMNGEVLAINGVADHVHLLIRLRATHTLASVVREVKKSSTHFLRESVPSFSWQVGYAGITVSPERLNGVAKYIRTQEEHHRAKSFEEELRELLDHAGIEYDSRYLD